jgi:argininosuccinate lyase
MMLATGELTGVSSIMPQKRNPAALEQLHAQASILLGEMQGLYLLAHNNRSGMFDYRMYDPLPAARSLLVFKLFGQIIDGLVVNKERALAAVNADYSTTTEIADALLQRADVPFRIGHHFASQLTDYGRAGGLTLHEIPYAEAARIYEVDTKQKLPLDEAAYREITGAEYSVFSRRGTGGPQPVEVQRMLVEERAKAATDRKWHGAARASLSKAAVTLDQVFDNLTGSM